MRLHRKCWSVILSAIILVQLLLPLGDMVQAEAAGRTIRVGYFEVPGYHEYDNEGYPVGYDVDYLNKIAEYTDWQYDYVRLKSWDDCLRALKAGEIDILGPGQRTMEREQNYNFSAYSIGAEFGAVLTLNTNRQLEFEDFEQLGKIKLGCVSTLIFKDKFFEYAANNGFVPNVAYYKDHDTLFEALNVGEIDAVVTNLMYGKKNMKVLAKFAPDSIYYMTQKNDYATLTQLDEAMNSIRIQEPQFNLELMDKYFRHYRYNQFTKAERELIAELPKLVVACRENRSPLAYRNEQNQLDGITIKLLNRIAAISGLRFEYIVMPDNATEEFLTDNNVSMIAGISDCGYNRHLESIKLSQPYLKTRKVVVGRRGRVISREDELTVAATGSMPDIMQQIRSLLPNCQIKDYGSLDAALTAVKDGQADVLVHNQYVIAPYLDRPQYTELTILPEIGMEDNLSIGMMRDVNDITRNDMRIVSILNKAIEMIPDDETAELVINETVEQGYQPGITDFMYRYRYFLFVLFVAIGIGCYYYISAVRLRRRNMLLMEENSTKLRNITNNINGGVIVLLPDQGFKIIYANKGFLELIKLDQEDYANVRNANYVTYVHPEDIEKLNKLVKMKQTEEAEQLSIKLRIRCNDGSYIQTLFNGTLAHNKNGEAELYCVIMDISEEQRMLDKLAMEQERYGILVEKSGDMIFDYDMNKESITLSSKFEEKFGWTVPKTFKWEEMQKVWWIYGDDRPAFKAMLDSFAQQEDSEAVIRFIKADSTPIWCNVFLHLIHKSEENIRIVGRISDVDAEMQEKQSLQMKAEKDMLSGLFNKDTFLYKAAEYMKAFPESSTALIFVDLDNFKAVNDQLGHLVGDIALKEAARKLHVIFTANDYLARFGGDEFCVLATDISHDALLEKMQWAVEKLQDTYQKDGKSVSISASIGIATAPKDGTTVEELLNSADKALYAAKEYGKNQYVVYDKNMQLKGYENKRS